MGSIVVTGAAGFIGSHTVDRLLAAGHKVIGIDNFRTGKRENLENANEESAFELIEADCGNRAEIDEIFATAKPEAVIHLAALVSVQESIEHPHENFRLNLEASHNVAIAAARNGASRIVFSSSAAVYGHQKTLPIRENVSARAISPYGATKLASEHLLRGYAESYGMTAVCQRYFNVFGPRQDPSSPYSGVISIFQEKFAAGEAVTIFGSGRQTRDFVSVHDVARANELAATVRVERSVTHNICTGRETSLLDLVTRFGRYYPDHAAPLFEEEREGDIHQSCGDPSQAFQHLRFRAEIDVLTGLREMIRGEPIMDHALDPRADLRFDDY